MQPNQPERATGANTRTNDPHGHSHIGVVHVPLTAAKPQLPKVILHAMTSSVSENARGKRRNELQGGRCRTHSVVGAEENVRVLPQVQVGEGRIQSPAGNNAASLDANVTARCHAFKI